MNVVDSSGWLEFFGRGPNAGTFREAILNLPDLVVPTLCLHEVYKRLASQRGAHTAHSAVASMKQGNVVPLGEAIALEAARVSLELKLAMADSVILATARSRKATLWTQDADFEGLDGVRFIAPPS